MLSLRVNNDEFRSKLRRTLSDRLERGKRVVQVTATEVVNHAKSLTGETRPPAKSGEGPRKAHPGGWADITDNLANSIQVGDITVTRTKVKASFGVEAEASAVMEYAEVLDQRDGIDVLGGADVEARKALKKYGKEILK